jgi:signal transduction histidine kinase
MGLEFALWRALIVFRVATLAYAAVLMVRNFHSYAWPAGGWLILAVMTLWTVLTSLAYAVPARRGWRLYAADLAVSAGCLLASRWIVAPAGVALGSPTLPMAWVAGPVVAWGIAGGRRLGAIAALLMGAADTVVRNGFSQGTVNGTVLMLLAGVSVGHLARLASDTEAPEIGGEAAELGRLAGEQEATLRALIASREDPTSARGGNGVADLRVLIDRYAAPGVTIAAPASPVWLPRGTALELTAAVASALSNVRAHAGPDAKAWVLLEDEPDAVTVTVRDNGTGIDADRLAEAERAGRLGVAQSIRGRVRDLGGTVRITGAPGRGTEVELRVPRAEAQ